MPTHRLSRRSVAAIKNSDIVQLYQLNSYPDSDSSWIIRTPLYSPHYDAIDWRTAYNGDGAPQTYPTFRAVVRAVLRIRPDIAFDVSSALDL